MEQSVEVQVLSAALVIYFVLFSTIIAWVGLGVFSYFWVNKAITTMLVPAHPQLTFLLRLGDLANQNRHWLWINWLLIIVVLSFIQLWWLYRPKSFRFQKPVVILLALIELLASLSFPFISDDIYSYLYSGKMVVEYHQNPFVVMPKDFFGRDQWLFFVKNVDNVYYHIGNTGITYYYGPLFLIYTSVIVKIIGPTSFFGLYFVWKLLNWLWFMLAGWLIFKLVKRPGLVVAIWFLNPLLQFELLTNNHNDLLMITFFLGGLYLYKLDKMLGWVSYFGSITIKFITIIGLPLMLLKEKYKETGYFLVGMVILFFHAIRPLHLWYYSWLYMFLPLVPLKKRTWLLIFVFQSVMLVNYSGYIWFNRWTGAPFLPSMTLVRWLLLISVLASEWQRILKIYLLKYKYFSPK